MGKLLDHLQRELTAVGYKRLSEETENNQRVMHALKEMVQNFEDQELSVVEGTYCLTAFQQLCRFQPLTPLKGTDDEWSEPDPISGIRANLRFESVVKLSDGICLNMNAIIFVQPDGLQTTDARSQVRIDSWPYMPTVQFVDVEVERRIITRTF